MNEFIEIFGDMKVAAVVMIIAAIVFLWKIYKVVEKHFRKKYDAEAQRAAQMNDILEQVKKYPEWRRQSIEYQKKYAEEIQKLQETQTEIIGELRENEEKRKKVKRSELRDRLLHRKSPAGRMYRKRHSRQCSGCCNRIHQILSWSSFRSSGSATKGLGCPC